MYVRLSAYCYVCMYALVKKYTFVNLAVQIQFSIQLFGIFSAANIIMLGGLKFEIDLYEI